MDLFAMPMLGIIISVLLFRAGQWVQAKTKSPMANPLTVGMVLLILLLNFTPLTPEGYLAGGDMITTFVLPATIVLALQIHRQWKLLRENVIPVLAGCTAGCITSLVTVLGLCRVFGINQALTASLLPKSVTTAIAVELAEKGGGYPAVAVSAVIITGVVSAVVAPLLVKLLRLQNPVAVGVAMGTSGHALATSRALELGETQGAFSGIALCISGIITSLIMLAL